MYFRFCINKMGGIVTIPIIPTEEDSREEHYESSPGTFTKRVVPPDNLSFPLGNRLHNGPIQEGDESVEESRKSSQKKRDEEIRQLEIQLERDYQKWDPEKRFNHEDSMRIYQRYNDHPFQPSRSPGPPSCSPRPSSHSRSSRSS